MNRTTQTPCLCSLRGTGFRLPIGRARTVILAGAILATLGIATTTRADRVAHDVAAGNVQVSGTVNADTHLSVSLSVNGFGIIDNLNVSDHKIKIGDTETDDVAGGVLISAVSQNLRNNFGSNMTHTVSMSVVNSDRSYEVASQSVPLNAAKGSIEDNVNFASAWFPYNSWIAGFAWNGTNMAGGDGNGLELTNFYGSAGLVLGTHFRDYWTNSVVSDASKNGTYFLDLRSFGIDSRRDGVLLVNHGKNEANYALSKVNNADDEMDGTWTIYTHDNRVNGGSWEQDPVSFVFVPRTNTAVVSGMIMGDATIAIYSGSSPQFTVKLRSDLGSGQYELKIPGRTPNDGVLIISPAGGTSVNSDNIVTYEANSAGDGWIIQSRDLPNAGLQTVPDAEVMCSFVFIPAERPGVTVAPSRNLMTTEAGGIAQFSVTLNGYPKPTADVTINLSSSDTTEGTVSPSTLTFTPNDWNVPMAVTVQGVDDAAVDGTQPYTIDLSAPSSTDANYNGLAVSSVGAINIDNEAGISVDASRVVTTESGGTATFSIWLNTAPTADVTVALSSSDLTEATVSPASLTFTPSDYATPQVVTVTGVDDAVMDGPISYFVVTASATSADPAYNGFDALNVVGENQDNDSARVILPADKLTVTEPNTKATFTVALGSEPTADVTVNFVSSDTTEGTVTPSVTFTPSNWSTPKTVTVTAADDNANDGSVEFSIITSVTSTDPNYAAINPDDVAVVTLDNEAAFTLPSGDLTYGIGDNAQGLDGYATVLDSDTASYSGGSLTVTITNGKSSDRLAVRNSGSNPGQIAVSGSTVSFGGVPFGTITGGTGTTPLTITFNNAATPASAEALIRSVTYQNVDASAAPQTRAVTLALADGISGVATATKNINLRQMRIYSYQQDADGGFGAYVNAADTQIHHQFPDMSFPAGFSSAGLWIDYDTASLIPTDQMQCLVRFTNVFGTAVGQIPLGARIVFAELIMNVSDSGHGARFNRMLIDWDPDSSTFLGFGDGIQLDDVEAVSGTNSFLGDQVHSTTTGTGLMTIGVTSDVQTWANGTNNYGWVMSTWEGGDNGTAFTPCESTNITLRPRLRVGWLPATNSVATFQQGVSNYVGTVDTQIRMVLPDTNYATSVNLAPDSAVNSTPVVNPQDVLIRFDSIIGSGEGQVPLGSTIHAAFLELTSIGSDSQGNGGLFYALLKPWSDTNTWNSWVDGISADGIEALSTPTVTLPKDGMGTVQSTRHNIEITADVQAWANGARENDGWVILPWDGGANGWGFNSAEATAVDTRPVLRVFYTPGTGLDIITLQKPTVSGGKVQLTFTGTAGRTYSVLRTGTLGGSWTSVGTATANSSGTATFTDNSPLPNAGFYRIAYP